MIYPILPSCRVLQTDSEMQYEVCGNHLLKSLYFLSFSSYEIKISIETISAWKLEKLIGESIKGFSRLYSIAFFDTSIVLNYITEWRVRYKMQETVDSSKDSETMKIITGSARWERRFRSHKSCLDAMAASRAENVQPRSNSQSQKKMLLKCHCGNILACFCALIFQTSCMLFPSKALRFALSFTLLK